MLKERRDLNLLCIMYEMKQLHIYERIGVCATRQCDNYVFHTDITVTGAYGRSPYYIESKLWNDLPSDIQHARTKTQFQNELKSLWG